VSAPPLPTGKPAPPAGASKLQQFVPLLLVMIIVLLVVILVTVIFLMKH
jgi:heme/copper-type cytochrome/quinol oxidase subunit 2